MGAPSKYISRAANRFAASRWTHREAAVSQREKRVQMPAKLGMNCGLKPPAGRGGACRRARGLVREVVRAVV